MPRPAAVITVVLAGLCGLAMGQPQYQITDLGLISPSDFASQGYGVSPGGVAFGRSVGSSNRAFTWTAGGGLVSLDPLPGRSYHVANGANDLGQAVGNATTTLPGAGSLPVLWQNASVSQLALLAGQSIGRANDVNASGAVVGSNGSGTGERGVIWVGGTPAKITATTPGGCYMVTAFRVNDAGLVAGYGWDPNNAARNVGILYDSAANSASEVPALPGHNGTIAFDVSDGGYVVGSSMLNQGSGLPFIWHADGGSTAIPLPAGTSQGSARGVNSSGWTVGVGSGLYAVPFLYDGVETFRLQDLIPGDSGWDLATNTSSAALGISENGVIVGTGVHDGQIRAFVMTPVPEPATAGALAILGLLASRRR